MERKLSPEETDDIFQNIIRKLPSVNNPAKLEELSHLALSMMLRRDSSKDLRDELHHRISAIVSSVTLGHSPEATRDAMRLAACGCIKMLRVAKERRQPRAVQAGVDGKPHPGGHSTHHDPHHASQAHPTGKKVILISVALAVAMVLMGAYLGLNRGDDSGYDPNETAKFVEQIFQAAQGNAQATHMFGGPLEVSAMNGIPVVTARGVPDRVCAASGMMLVKKGLLSVNGTTPSRISSAIITELCNQEDGGATIMWAATK